MEAKSPEAAIKRPIRDAPQHLITDFKIWPFRHGGGKQWVADLPLGVCAPGDTSDAPARSTLILREDGTALGPRHAIHAEIQSVGGGRYSHWNDHLLLSTSDDTDPNVNGRRYSVGSGTSTPLVLGLGGCHLHGALAQLHAQGRIYPLWPAPLLAYSPREALQLIEFHRGTRGIPDWLHALTAAATWDWPTGFLDAHIVFLEFGASIDVAYGSYWLPRVCVSEALLEPISRLSREGWRAARKWFHLGLMMQNEKVRVQCVEQLVELIPGIPGDQKLLRDIVENARGHRQEAHDVTRTIAKIVDLLQACAISVLGAHNAFTPDGRPVSWPGNFPK